MMTIAAFFRIRDAGRPFNVTGLLLSACFLLLILHLSYSIAPVLDGNVRRTLFLGASLLFFPVLLATFLICAATRAPWPVSPVSDRGLQSICAGFAVTVVGSALYFSFPNAIALPSVVAFAVLNFLLWRRGGIVHVVYGTLAVAVLLLAVKALGPDPNGADMLPLIKWTNQTFLAGRNPYDEHNTFYLPVQWLLYLPLVGLGLDQRLLNLFSLFGCLALFAAALRGSSYRVACLAVFAGLCASRPAVEMMAQGEVWPVWLILSGYAFALSTGRHWLAAVLVGVLLAMHQPFLLLFALAGIYDLRAFGLRKAVLLGIVSLSVYAVFVLSFSRGSMDFFVWIYITLPHLAAGVAEQFSQNSTQQISLVSILVVSGLSDLRQGLQVLCGVRGIALVTWPRTMDRPRFLATAGLSYIFALALNVMVFKILPAYALASANLRLLTHKRRPA